MKKRRLHRKLKLRKDTLYTLGRNAMRDVAGGVTAGCSVYTCDEVCVATTLVRTCAEDPTGTGGYTVNPCTNVCPSVPTCPDYCPR